ncbi:hypothetical protein CcaverHIS002_0300980 [Cutaneotrichosporon cavernicola]|nr:hypothetical protein CcaverHIS002_0300980 [Cutaneotrichosporon cavernicola]
MIFDAAPYESLLALRTTCRTWRDRADAMTVRHVVVVENECVDEVVSYPGWKLQRRTLPYTITTGEGYRIPRTEWYYTPLAACVRRIDLWGGPQVSSGPEWLHKVKHVRVLYDMTPYRTDWQTPTADVHIVGETFAASVIHVPDLADATLKRWSWSRSGPKWDAVDGGIPRALTVVLRDLPSQPNYRHFKYMGVLVRTLARMLADQVDHPSSTQPPVAITIVNLNAWRTHPPDSPPSNPGHHWFTYVMWAAGASRRAQYQKSEQWLHTFEERVEAIRYLSLQAFQDEVSKEVFEAVIDQHEDDIPE